jgi:hypothetical protein
LPASSKLAARTIKPQLLQRPATAASICSCHCDGPGPGPYCTCPDSMQCEFLIEDLHLGSSEYAGSYCIPKGTAYDASAPHTECVEPICGAKHPH